MTTDNVQKMVTVGMLSTAAPILMGAKQTVDLIYNSALSVVGLLVEEAGDLKSCNVALTTCATPVIMSGITSVQKMGENKLQAKTYLRITTSSNDGLYVYDGAADTLSASLYTFTLTDFNLGQIDSAHFFFHDGDTIFKLAHSNNALATVFIDSTPPGVIWSVKLTDNRVVYTKNTSTNNEIKSVLKSGNNPLTLVSAGTADAVSPWAISANNGVYYMKYIITGGGTTTAQSAGHISDDGVGLSELADSAWIGGSIPTTFSVVVGLPLEKIIRVEGCALLVCSNGPLKSFIAATFGSPITIGAVPSDIDVFSANFGLGSDLLGNGFSSTWASDVFYLNPDVAGSVVRITNNTAVSELPLW